MDKKAEMAKIAAIPFSKSLLGRFSSGVWKASPYVGNAAYQTGKGIGGAALGYGKATKKAFGIPVIGDAVGTTMVTAPVVAYTATAGAPVNKPIKLYNNGW